MGHFTKNVDKGVEMKEQILTKLKKYNHALILLYYIVILAWFRLLEYFNTAPRHIMYSKLDDYIPFVSIFVIPYFLWFAYIAAAMVYFCLRSREDFLKLSIFMFSGMTVCLIIYTLFPNGQNLRPEVVGNDIFSLVIKWLYDFDTPTNSAPSMHVLNSVAVHISIARYSGFKKSRLLKSGSFILMVLIILSTVFLKQHSVMDVMYGLLLSAILYVLVYKTKFKGLQNLWKSYEESDSV